MIPINPDILEEMQVSTGETLYALTMQQPVLLVFLRHFGCVFCKEALDDLSARREHFEENGVKLVFVHMADRETAEKYFDQFRLSRVTHVCDPLQQYYVAFGLYRGSFNQLYGLRVWLRGYTLKQERGYRLELAHKLGDSTQMPGVFILSEGRIVESFIHRYASDRPDYDKLVACCIV